MYFFLALCHNGNIKKGDEKNGKEKI